MGNGFRSIEELEAPDFKHNSSTDLIRQRAGEKERNREASQNTKPGMIKRMQFTFSVDQPARVPNSATLKKLDSKPTHEIKDCNKHSGSGTYSSISTASDSDDMAVADDEAEDDPPLTQRGRKRSASSTHAPCGPASICFPSFFPDSFGSSAVLNSPPSNATHLSYGEGVGVDSTADSFT